MKWLYNVDAIGKLLANQVTDLISFHSHVNWQNE